jgi:transposase
LIIVVLGLWVKLKDIDIDETLKDVESLLSTEKDLSPALLSMIKVMIMLLKLLTDRMGLNSRNSSTKSRPHEGSHPQVIQIV